MIQISISDQAVKQISDMLAEEEHSNMFLRLGVNEGGCSGFSYSLGFDNEQSDEDLELEINGLKVVMDEKSSPLINGLSIDYKQSAMGGGFTVENPNATATCGCGSSFRTATEAGKPEEC
ncbi:HesB/IscA family protein [Longirhabdus pacifica]|uniref:HesB/IscA family protein n=1 Tax=Longirhabdus pacifica TaxID=2305227 RepID=UPI001008F0FD|nr:iron-sulfur cluster assembly accessory protein [Longirhabdus pacifica]